MYRPTLIPGLTALWRGPHTLQLGLDPDRALVLDLPNPSVAGILDLLNGDQTEPTLFAAARRRGISEPDAKALLDTLRRHRLIMPAPNLYPGTVHSGLRHRMAAEVSALARPQELPDTSTTHGDSGDSAPAAIMRRRAAAKVRLTGPGRLGVPIATLLASAGIGHIDAALDGVVTAGEPMCLSTPGDPPHSRAQCADLAVARFAPATRIGPTTRKDSASFLVHVGPLPVPAALFALTRRKVAHITVMIRDGTPVIGPLVPPAVAPCVNCIDLHRTDRDPAWPRLAAQLAAPEGAPLKTYTETCAVTTALAAAAYASEEILRYLDGRVPRTVGATVEVPAAGAARRRSWSAHPDCGCTGRTGSAP